MNSQTSQSKLIDNYWSSGPGNKIVLLFKNTGDFILFTNRNQVGYEKYYVSEDCEIGGNFNSSKIGVISSGSHISTEYICYLFEFDNNKLKIKSSQDNSWQTFYLAKNFSPN
ncbi:hypothetical protein ACXGQW_07885 [Wenyingzhuangia sp. IMCC45533]